MTVLRRPVEADPVDLRLAGLPPAVVTRAARRLGTPRRATLDDQIAALRGATGRAADDAVVLLCDGYGATVARVAELLEQPPDVVAERLERGRPLDEPAAATAPCAAWPLVARRRSLPQAERAAADAHVAQCHRCRDAVPRPRP